ncbi:putative pseudouridine synthase, RsuA/RluB/C/D/E/F, High mobility group box domain superfamily [Plasmopara halstedii]
MLLGIRAFLILTRSSTKAHQINRRRMISKVRRHQSDLPHDQTLDSLEGNGDQRGGPSELQDLQLHILSKNENFVVLNKGPDERLDGAFDVTLEKALTRDFPHVDKFRWIHQLDFATSGVLVVGVNKEATATGCRLFREKQVQKEYLAVIRGHLPFDPAKCTGNTNAPAKSCTYSKLEMFIKDMEELERFRNQQRGSRKHQKMPGYPRGARHGPNLFAMEQAQLLRDHHIRENSFIKTQTRALTPTELAFTKMTWHDLTKEEKDTYLQRAKVDKERFLREFSEFLSQEKIRLAHERKYDSLNGDDRGRCHEPVAYIFDSPILEPHESTGVFRMLVGSKNDIMAKQSTTICFVLGHSMYNGEPVTKVLLRPLNGRRHQLRLHLADHGFPIAGDVTYGSQEDEAPRMMLHAWRIWLCGCPADQKKYGDLYFESPDPFALIVPSERKVSTITYHKHNEARAQHI